MKVWISEHPYLASAFAVLAIVLLYILFHRGSSSNATAQAGSPAADPNVLAAGIQSQQTAAQVQIAQGQIAAHISDTLAAAGVANNQTQAQRDVALQQILTGGSVANYSAAAQLEAVQAQTGAAVSIANTNAGAAVQLAGINADATIKVAGIQADVAKNTTAAQLALGLDTNKTSIALAGVDLQKTINTNATAAAISANTNATAAEINQQNETTKQIAIGTAGAVAQNEINQQGQQVADAFSLAQQYENDLYGPGGIFVGVNRYGGNLQSNQATVEAAILNQPQVGVAIQSSSASQAQSSSSMWSNIVSGIIGGGTKVATAAIGG